MSVQNRCEAQATFLEYDNRVSSDPIFKLAFLTRSILKSSLVEVGSWVNVKLWGECALSYLKECEKMPMFADTIKNVAEEANPLKYVRRKIEEYIRSIGIGGKMEPSDEMVGRLKERIDAVLCAFQIIASDQWRVAMLRDHRKLCEAYKVEVESRLRAYMKGANLDAAYAKMMEEQLRLKEGVQKSGVSEFTMKYVLDYKVGSIAKRLRSSQDDGKKA